MVKINLFCNKCGRATSVGSPITPALCSDGHSHYLVQIAANKTFEASSLVKDPGVEVTSSSSSSQYACVKRIDISASLIAKDNRLLYDMFTPPQTHLSYCPNRRIMSLFSRFQNIVPSDEAVLKIECQLRRNSLLMQSWSYPPGGSETLVNNPLLITYLTSICECIKSSEVVIRENAMLPFETQLCDRASKPEMYISYRNSVLIASEAKRTDCADIVALMQCFQVCGDSALDLFRKGLKSDDCVVPGVICCGETFSIVALYFAPETFPVMTYLSGTLHIRNCIDRLVLSRWGIALAQFASETIELLYPSTTLSLSADVRFRLRSDLFFKPVRNVEKEAGSGVSVAYMDISHARGNLDMVMYVYSMLDAIPSSKKYVLFPLGVLSCPAADNKYGSELRQLLVNFMNIRFPMWPDSNSYTHIPFIVFQDLLQLDGWKSSDERPPLHLTEQYLSVLEQAVKVLNEAKVAHMDLRPANILWREVRKREVARSGSSFGSDRKRPRGEDTFGDQDATIATSGTAAVELQLIDFEDSLPFGLHVKHAANYRCDPSYPDYQFDLEPATSYYAEFGCFLKFNPTDVEDRSELAAAKRHNDFFFHSIAAWLRIGEENDTFASFMRKLSPMSRRAIIEMSQDN